MPTTKEDETRPRDWAALVSLLIHPLKVAILEAMSWIDEPLSSSDLSKIIGSPRYRLSHVSYHVRKLAQAEVIELVRQRPVRGATESFFKLS